MSILIKRNRLPIDRSEYPRVCSLIARTHGPGRLVRASLSLILLCSELRQLGCKLTNHYLSPIFENFRI